ncbi:hypothetical protein EI555_009387 [Monodon monoceros]|uniref:Uncharacterized protein n=1 Tax=Monodon monoceros TaxID=40151 RepID=A0A4V5P645_MONMO|nr:hypothetical protein EI555_009387 [Monodon monoceros]
MPLSFQDTSYDDGDDKDDGKEKKGLQTGMRSAFGRPQGTVVRVHIGQVIMSSCTKLQNKEHMIEALDKVEFKFPGYQKIYISKKWEFTKFNVDGFENMVAENRLILDGCGVKYIPSRGPLDTWPALHSRELWQDKNQGSGLQERTPEDLNPNVNPRCPVTEHPPTLGYNRPWRHPPGPSLDFLDCRQQDPTPIWK